MRAKILGALLVGLFGFASVSHALEVTIANSGPANGQWDVSTMTGGAVDASFADVLR
jgi:hypothetical protein